MSPLTDDSQNRLRPVAIGVGLILAAVVAVYESAFTPQRSLLFFYLPGIALIGWYARRWAAVFVAIVCALLPLMTMLFDGSQDFRFQNVAWRVVDRLVLLAAFAVLLSFLRMSQRREHSLSRIDSLTGLVNRTGILERAAAESSRSIRSGLPLTMAFIDCDNFKAVNDSQGHLEGDEVLKSVAETLKSTIRGYDVVARLGGDEFVILMPEVSDADAQTTAIRIRDQLASTMAEHNWSVTFSMGVATFSIPPNNVAEMIRTADELMYSVKHSGKNGIEFKVVESP